MNFFLQFNEFIFTNIINVFNLSLISIFMLIDLISEFFYLDLIWSYQIHVDSLISYKFKYFIPCKVYAHLFTLLVYFSLFFTFFIFFIFFMSYETNNIVFLIVKELMWLLSKLFREVEKEFLNIDDSFFLFVVFFIVFGWFFLLCVIPANMFDNVISYLFAMIPFMCFLIVFIPIFIIYDQGAFFLVYLRGTSSTTIFILELIYDYLCILIIFMRVLIQNLRFFFMFLVYFELQEHIYVFPMLEFMPWPDPYLGEAGTRMLLPRTIKWFFLYKFPILFMMSLYYIGHLFVIFVSNTVAYLFLVFWLYLLFYSCFYTRKFETFFKNRREKYNKLSCLGGPTLDS